MNTKIILPFLVFVQLVGFSQSSKEKYQQRVQLFADTPNTPNEIIFLGNSITAGCDWKSLFGKVNAINRGISGDVTEGILDRLKEVTDSQPKKIFLLIGTNDLARGRSVDYVVRHTDLILQKIAEQSPNTRLYIQTILPINPVFKPNEFRGHKKNKQEILEVNKHLKAVAKSHHITLINIHKRFKNSQGYLKEKYTYDGLHLNAKGYQKWKRVLSKYVY